MLLWLFYLLWLLLLLLLSSLLLFLFVIVEFECRKYCTVRIVMVDYRAHRGMASEGIKSKRGATCNGRLSKPGLK